MAGNNLLTLFVFILLFCGFSYLSWSRQSLRQYFNIRSDIAVFKRSTSDSTRTQPDPYASYDFDAICQHEWEQLSNDSFFRRDAAFYLIDYSTINLFFVGRAIKRNDFIYHVTLQIDGKIINSTIIQGEKIWFSLKGINQELAGYKIDIPFELSEIYPLIDENYLNELVRANRTAIMVHVYDKELKKGTERELNVVPKYLHKKSYKKHSAMICSKLYSLSKKNAKDMEWWIEINRRMGFEKITIFNNTLEYSVTGDDGFETVFKKYAGYIEVIQMNCLPHFSSNGSNYVKSINELRREDPGKHAIFEMLAFDLCYLKYAQDYRHIAVIDMDEVFLPPLIEDQFFYHNNYDYVKMLTINSKKDSNFAFQDLRCNRYTSPEADLSKAGVEWTYRSKVEFYIDDIIRRDNHYIDPQSLYFQNAYQLSNYSMSKIVAKFDEYFSSPKFNSSAPDHFIDVDDDSLAHEREFRRIYRFKISGPEEVAYAKTLIKIFNHYLQPYLKSIQSKRPHIPLLYDRFFSLTAGEYHHHVWGKTIHNTRSTQNLGFHFPVLPGLTLDHPNQFFKVEPDFGQVSHFRGNNRVQPSINSVRQLIFDYNYLNCFFKPILHDSTD